MFTDRRLLRELRRVRPWYLGAVALGALAGAALVYQAYLLAAIVADVFLHDAARDDLWTPLVLLLAVSLVRVGLSFGSEATGARLAARIKRSLRRRLIDCILSGDRAPVGGDPGPAGLAAGGSSGELAATVTDGIAALEAYFARYVPQMALAVVVPVTVGVFVLARDPLSGTVLFLTAPLIPLFMNLIGKLAAAISRKQWREMTRLSAVFVDTLSALASLRILGGARCQIDRIEAVTTQFRGSTMRVLRVAFLSGLVLELVATLSVAVVAVQIGLRLLYGHLGFEHALFILILAPEFYQPLRQLGARAHAGLNAVNAAERIYALLAERSEDLPAEPSSPPTTTAPMPARGRLQLATVGVDYPVGDGEVVRALDQVTFEIPAGKTVALVGRSGAGKTTVARLLLRFMEPTRGWLLVDGRDASTIAPEHWRRQVAFVPQQPHLFHDTIAANIRLARPEATDNEVAAAARAARAEAFIEALPDGYETVVGEQGARLSGGQIQRIALARAFLKDAGLVVLDEPSAHLDARLLAELNETTARLLAGRSALIIAHRLGTVRQADLVVVLDRGRVVETGRPAELAQGGGLYQRLLAVQGGGQ